MPEISEKALKLLRRVRAATDIHGGFPKEWIKWDEELFVALLDAKFVSANHDIPDGFEERVLMDFTITDPGRAYIEGRSRDVRDRRLHWVVTLLTLGIGVAGLIVALVALGVGSGQ